MPKLIDYPRTSYAGAWELGEIVDDTGGKCAIETAARKLNRKVSGSFKAIIGSAVKFGLLTSKRDLLTTTTLFKRIKHAYDKQEELLFHREAFLTPPLFTQLCRKFRTRELPVQMLDVMLIREFSVEEINAPGVAKAFVEGSRMVGLLDENNIIADIDALTARNTPRRELASPTPSATTYRDEQINFTNPKPDLGHYSPTPHKEDLSTTEGAEDESIKVDNLAASKETTAALLPRTTSNSSEYRDKPDVIASLFGLVPLPSEQLVSSNKTGSEPWKPVQPNNHSNSNGPAEMPDRAPIQVQANQLLVPSAPLPQVAAKSYQIQISGPGVNTSLSITEEEDIVLAVALLEKIRRQLKN